MTGALWSRGVAVVAAAVVCGVVSVGLTSAAARYVRIATSLPAFAWAACAAVVWACGASHVGVVQALPLFPAAVVAAPLAVMDWKVRRLPDTLTLSAGSATAAAMATAAAAESPSWLPWLTAGSAVGLTLATLAALQPVPRRSAVVCVWVTMAAGCVMAGSGRLTSAVTAGALATGVVLVAHLCAAAGFGDVKITPIVCGAAWSAWDPVGGIRLSLAAAFGVLWLSAALGGLVAAVSRQGRVDGVPLGVFLPGAALVVAVATNSL